MPGAFFNQFSRQVDNPNIDKPLPSPVKGIKRDHRNARVFSGNLSPGLTLQHTPPQVPVTARLQRERPAPLQVLPELPIRSFTPNAKQQERMYGSPKWYGGAGTWLAQFRAPWARDQHKPKSLARPSTPKSAFTGLQSSKDIKQQKTLSYFDYTLPEEDDFAFSPALYADSAFIQRRSEFVDVPLTFDPPPVYRKRQPEGGMSGWLTVVAAFLIQFSTIGYLSTWNIFEDTYAHVWLSDESPLLVRFIGCFHFFIAFFLSLVSGKLADLGYFRSTIMGGSLLFTVSLFLLSILSEEDYGKTFLLHSVLMGAGIGLTFVPSMVMVLRYFKRRKGLVLGIVLGGGAYGGMIFPPVLRTTIATQGLGGAVRITAIIVAVCLLFGCVIVFMYTPPKEEEPEFPLPHLDLVKYRGQKEYLFAAAATCFGLLAYWFPVMYLELLGLTRGADPVTAFNSVVVLSVVGILGRIIAGFVADLCGVWNTILLSSGFTALLLLTMTAVKGAKSLIAETIFYGFFSEAWFCLMMIGLVSFTTHEGEIGTRIGLVLTLCSPIFLFSPILYNAMLGPKDNWTIPGATFSVLFLGVTALLYFTRVGVLSNTYDGKRKYIKGVTII